MARPPFAGSAVPKGYFAKLKKERQAAKKAKRTRRSLAELGRIMDREEAGAKARARQRAIDGRA